MSPLRGGVGEWVNGRGELCLPAKNNIKTREGHPSPTNREIYFVPRITTLCRRAGACSRRYLNPTSLKPRLSGEVAAIADGEGCRDRRPLIYGKKAKVYGKTKTFSL